jgi:hypothetical protein
MFSKGIASEARPPAASPKKGTVPLSARGLSPFLGQGGVPLATFNINGSPVRVDAPGQESPHFSRAPCTGGDNDTRSILQ